jgi:hypothetical protein
MENMDIDMIKGQNDPIVCPEFQNIRTFIRDVIKLFLVSIKN